MLKAKANISQVLRVLLFPLLVLAIQSQAQQVTERIITRDKGDSMLLKAFRSTFDTAGNFYFETLMKGPGERFALQTNKKTYPPVYWGNSIALAPYKALISDAFFSDSTKKKLYYKNKSGTTVYGPAPGRIREILEFGNNHLAIELCTGSRSTLFIDGTAVNTTDTLKQHWLCSFSDNGNVIYTTHKEGMYRLYVNYSLLDSSRKPFTDIAINNNAFYTFVKPTEAGVFVHTPQGKYGPMVAATYSGLWENNGYYYWGCKNNECTILANGKLFDHIPEPRATIDEEQTMSNATGSEFTPTIKPYSSAGFVCTYTEDRKKGLILNKDGKKTLLDFEYNGDIATDHNGGYAFYGIRTDTTHQFSRTYKYINGQEKLIPPLPKKVANRLMPLQLSPDGSSVYYYQTRDSIYLFRNDTPFSKPIWVKTFAVWDEEILPHSTNSAQHYFKGINMAGATYIIYDNTLSRALPLAFLAYDRFDEPTKGSIVAGQVNEHGYYLIEYISPGKYLLIINNQIYKDLEGIDYVFGDQGYFYDGTLVFYGLKGKAFVEYKVNF